MRHVFAVFAALVVLIGSTLNASAQPSTTVENGVPVNLAYVGGHYVSSIGRTNPNTFHTSTGMGVEAWKFDAAYGQCIDITMRSNQLAPALMLFDGPGFAPAIRQDQARGSWAQIQVIMPRTSTYYVAAIAGIQGAPEGEYTLDITPCQLQPARDPSLGPDGRPWRARY